MSEQERPKIEFPNVGIGGKPQAGMQLPSDGELFAESFSGELSQRQAFAKGDGFYESLDGIEPIDLFCEPPPVDSQESQLAVLFFAFKHLSGAQKVILTSIVLIAGMVLYVSLGGLSEPVVVPVVQKLAVGDVQKAAEEAVADSTAVGGGQVEQAKPLGEIVPPRLSVVEPREPLSLGVARNFYLNREYDEAVLAYLRVYENLDEGPQDDLIRDFLYLRIAACMEGAGDQEQAAGIYQSASNSRSPAVRVVANYRRSLLEMEKKQYLQARTRAYQALALIDVIEFDEQWSRSLKRDCYFLVAEAVTKKALLLDDADKDLPDVLWSLSVSSADPFSGLTESQLRAFLNSGSQRLEQALLGPQIETDIQEDDSARYTVTSYGAPLEELLSRFAANAGADIGWSLKSEEIGLRKQAINLYLRDVTIQQFMTVASGSGGLLAEVDRPDSIGISNPNEYHYASEQISLLCSEAISLWQQFLIRFHDDQRVANAHFALALLYTQDERVAEAISEYKLIVDRFSQSALAPFSLFNSSGLQADQYDHYAARRDLRRLVEQYPNVSLSGRAYLRLADITVEVGDLTEARRLYIKIYNLSWSSESQKAAALGAGKSSYSLKDHENASKWLTRYLSFADEEDEDFYQSHYLVGKSNQVLGDTEAACNAFQFALAGDLSQKEYIETISGLIEGYIEQGRFLETLEVLENAYTWQFSESEAVEMLLLESKIFRAVGLVDKAITKLEDRAEYVSEPQFKAKIFFELANCYIEEENLEQASKRLADVLDLAEPSSLTYETALSLADVCLKRGRHAQAKYVCSQLLELQPPQRIKQKALKLLAMAYEQQENYDKAALALLGQWK